MSEKSANDRLKGIAAAPEPQGSNRRFSSSGSGVAIAGRRPTFRSSSGIRYPFAKQSQPSALVLATWIDDDHQKPVARIHCIRR
jgi:hypothetical protein